MARIAVYVSDLMLLSRVSESLGAAGHEPVTVAVAATPGELPEGTEAIVCDLDATDPAAIAALGLPVVGFYSHVDTATRDRARDAGLDLVIPRSRMARELPELVDRLL